MNNAKKYGLLTYVKVKADDKSKYLEKSAEFLHRISQQTAFVNYFHLQDEQIHNHFLVYSTWQEKKTFANDFLADSQQALLSQPLEEQVCHVLRSETVGDQIYEMTMLHEKMGRVTFFQLKPGSAEAFIEETNKLIDEYYNERTFLNIYVLQEISNPENFMVYETWIDKEDFINVQMKRTYRRHYQDVINSKLTNPAKIQFWQLISSENRTG